MAVIRGLRSNKGLTSKIVCCPVCKTSRIYKRKSRKAKSGEPQRLGIYRCEECHWCGDVPEIRERRMIVLVRSGGVANEAC